MTNRSAYLRPSIFFVFPFEENSPRKENVSRIVVLLSKSVVNNKLNVNTIITSIGSIGRVERETRCQRAMQITSAVLEDVILNEQRTTEQERRAIHEGQISSRDEFSSRRVFFSRFFSEKIRRTETHSTHANGQTAERRR